MNWTENAREHRVAPQVSVVIPTLDRPAALARALASVFGQSGLEPGAVVEVIVVDNSAGGSAAPTLAGFPAKAIRLVNEPRPGVANARNAGVAAARGEWVAFLDDDEEAEPGWLAALLKVALARQPDAVFGPVEARAERPGAIGAFEPYFERRLDAADGADVTAFSAHLGTNNSLFHRVRCLGEAAPFDPALNQSGGEDSLLLERLRRRGRRFAYADEARVIEWAPARRLTWAYVRKRKFLSGQIRVFVQRMAAPRRLDRIAFWMLAGSAQFALLGAASLALRPIAPARAESALARAYGGLGKLLWTRRFRPALYGAGLVS